jgi:hypothetical protein
VRRGTRLPLLMFDFLETKPFVAACIGAAVLALCYLAGIDDWRRVALPVAVAIGFYLMFRDEAT